MTDGDCPGCEGSGRDWVCLGTGYAYPEAKTGLCPRCLGTGRCDLCEAFTSVRRPQRVLIIDDDPSILEELGERFRADARRPMVTTARSVLAAFADLVEATPDVIVCEFHLGSVTSDRYLPGLRSAAPHALIVVFTCDPQFAHVAGVLDQGADLVLDKSPGRMIDLVNITLRTEVPRAGECVAPVATVPALGAPAFLVGAAEGLQVWQS